MKPQNNNYLLIDGSNLLHRNFYIAAQRPLINSRGEDVGCVFNFLNSLRTLSNKFNVPGNNMIISWDKKLSYNTVNFRAKHLQHSTTTYKGNRDAEKAKQVYANGELVEQLIDYLGAHNFYPNVLEADDCISWLSTSLQGKKTIVSVDKDLMQLVSVDVDYYNPIKNVVITPHNFEEHAEVPLENFVLYKAILGDKSDNVPGLEGFGKVKAAKLAKNFNSTSITDEQKQIVERNIQMMDLSIGYNLEVDEVGAYNKQLASLSEPKKFNKKDFQSVCEDKEFKSILRSMSAWEETFTGPATDLNDYLVQLFGSK